MIALRQNILGLFLYLKHQKKDSFQCFSLLSQIDQSSLLFLCIPDLKLTIAQCITLVLFNLPPPLKSVLLCMAFTSVYNILEGVEKKGGRA